MEEVKTVGTEGGEEETESEGTRCVERWKNGSRMNCVYSTAMEKSIFFSFFDLLVQLYSLVSRRDAI